MSRVQRVLNVDLEEKFKQWQLGDAAEALFIANTTLLIGLFLYQLINPQFLFSMFLGVDLDLGLLSILILWVTMIVHPAGLSLIVGGWTLAGIYIKRKRGASSSALLRGSAIPVTIAILSAGVVLISLLFTTPGGFVGILSILLIFVVLYIFSAIFTVFGIVVSQFITFNRSHPYTLGIERDYLVLDVLPVGETISHCPFRSDLPGCSYLGYKAPDRPLICDYESTFLRCRVYSHIYHEYVGEKK